MTTIESKEYRERNLRNLLDLMPHPMIVRQPVSSKIAYKWDPS